MPDFQWKGKLMKQALMTGIALFALPLLLLVACGSRNSSEPTLTFHRNGCSYSGPATVASKFALTWVIEESDHSAFIYGVVTLSQGMSVQDLATIPAEDPPPSWVTKLNAAMETHPGTYTESVDLGANAVFHEGPIYIVCFFGDEDFAMGAVGPIDVMKQPLGTAALHRFHRTHRLRPACSSCRRTAG
jgi:hypothetical protein